MRTRGRRALAGAVLACAAIPATAGAANLTVGAIQVSQAVQTPGNDITLIAQRSTVVRATVQVSDSAVNVPNVTGRLHVFRNNVRITPVAGIAPVTNILARPAPSLETETHTLNFELPSPTGIAASTNVDIRVDITPVTGESNTADNSGSLNNLRFRTRTTPRLRFVRVDYMPAGDGPPQFSRIDPGVGDAFVRGILPVNDSSSVLYARLSGPRENFDIDFDNDNRLDAVEAEGSLLLAQLAVRRQLAVFGQGAANRTFLYGWIRNNPIAGNGLAEVGGRVAFGNAERSRHQRSYAHELTHNFGLNHNSRDLDEVGWDVRARLPGNPSQNNTSGRVKPTTLRDIQVGGLLTNQAWIDTTSYQALLGSSVLAAERPPGGAGSLQRAKDGTTRVLVVHGILDPQGRELVVLDPAFRLPWVSEPTVYRPTGRFVAEVRTNTGRVMRRLFDGEVHDDSERDHDRSQFGFFEVMIAVPPDEEVVALRIRDAQGRVLRDVRRTAPPRVSVTSPQPRARLGTQTRVVWRIVDPDTPARDLMTHVAYSPDGGRTYVPVAARVTGTTVTVATAALPTTKAGAGILRLVTGDGLNTVITDVRGLSAPGARGLD